MGEPMVRPWRTPETMRGAVGFDLHAAAAAIALLATPELAIEFVHSDRDAGGEPCQGRHETLAVGLPRRFKTKHV